jgi:hypothetical protein
MYKLFILIVFISVGLTGAAQAQKNFTASVQVQVISSADTPPTEMGKLVEKALTDMVDITAGKEKADYMLLIFLEKIPTPNGPAFYAVTFNSFKGAECSYKNNIIDGKVARTDCKALSRFATIAFISETQIKDKAAEIAKSFNEMVIEPDRKAFKINRNI